MNKSIPISLAIIAISVASVAGTYLYDRAQVANALEARQEKIVRLAQQEAQQQCRDRVQLLTSNLLQKNIEANQYAPAPGIKNPETLKDVQAVFYRNLRNEITKMKLEAARLKKLCPPHS